ncbi:MAG: tetratricopeptide repeat protein [Pseudomonadota bacterium]
MMWFKKSLAAISIVLMLGTGPSALAQNAEDLAMMEQFMNVMDGYFSIIESTHDIASDPEKSAILQMQKIKEIYEERGEAANAVGVLRDVLANSTNPAVRSAATMILGDLLKETGRTDSALEVLQRGLKESIVESNQGSE